MTHLPFRGAFSRRGNRFEEIARVRDLSEGTFGLEELSRATGTVEWNGGSARYAGDQIGIRSESACSFPMKLTARMTA